MSEVFSMDFSKDRIQFPELGVKLSVYLDDFLGEPDASRGRMIGALVLLRRILRDRGALSLFEKEAPSNAIDSLEHELERIEYALRDLEDGAPPSALFAPTGGGGRPAESNAVIDFQAHAVAAVHLLGTLEVNPLSKDDAIAAVAPTIPHALLQKHSGTKRRLSGALTPEEQLRAWLDAFGRKRTRRFGRLQQLFWEIDVENDGEFRKRSAEQVLEWLRHERERLLSGE